MRISPQDGLLWRWAFPGQSCRRPRVVKGLHCLGVLGGTRSWAWWSKTRFRGRGPPGSRQSRTRTRGVRGGRITFTLTEFSKRLLILWPLDSLIAIVMTPSAVGTGSIGRSDILRTLLSESSSNLRSSSYYSLSFWRAISLSRSSWSLIFWISSDFFL